MHAQSTQVIGSCDLVPARPSQPTPQSFDILLLRHPPRQLSCCMTIWKCRSESEKARGLLTLEAFDGTFSPLPGPQLSLRPFDFAPRKASDATAMRTDDDARAKTDAIVASSSGVEARLESVAPGVWTGTLSGFSWVTVLCGRVRGESRSFDCRSDRVGTVALLGFSRCLEA